MNKHAAEKIAQEYYALGAQLALTKQANIARGVNKVHNAILATLGGGVTAGLSVPQIKKLLSMSDSLRHSFARGEQAKLINKVIGNQNPELTKIIDNDTSGIASLFLGAGRQHLQNAGSLSTADQIINAMPGVLGIGAGLGVGTGIYKGLGKLDKKLKLY